ncbi:hypothetical protein SDC9_197790 [bioreactor metagenome]|uniref:Uncharacterized protein n=1 Tax=bioreactor metagenome TaxID=1076179 RepID=A0A645IP93_9ZZZZ
MVIQMVLRKICEHTYIKITKCNPFKVKRMGRNLHYNIAYAFFLHIGKKLHKLQGFWRCSFGMEFFIPYHIAYCAYNTCFPALLF